MTEQEKNQAAVQEPVADSAGTDDAAFDRMGTDAVATDAQTIPPDSPSPTALGSDGKADLDMLRDVELSVTAELGRTRLTLGEITNLAAGSIVTLAKAAGEPADLRINDQHFASGEVIVIDGYFAVKITKLLSKEERMKNFT